MKQPEIIVHERIEPPLEGKHALGWFDSSIGTIHVYERNLLYDLVLEHEKVHSERRNKLVNRFLDSVTKNKKRGISSVLSVVVLMVIIAAVEERTSLNFLPLKLFFVILSLAVVFLNQREESIAARTARDRLKNVKPKN